MRVYEAMSNIPRLSSPVYIPGNAQREHYRGAVAAVDYTVTYHVFAGTARLLHETISIMRICSL